MIILRRPIVTEKSMKLAKEHFYTFEVDKNATKLQIAKIVADKFSVKVLGVKVINVKGRVKSQKSVRKLYRTAGLRKAIVQIGKTQKIAIFETPKEEVTVTTGEGEPIKIKEKRNFLRGTKVKVESSPPFGGAPTTQRKVITGK